MDTPADPVWNAVVEVALPLGPVTERTSRYGDKPALHLAGREIAHGEAPGHVDLRITAAGWRAVRGTWAADPAVVASPGRRDWIELVLTTPADVARVVPLVAATVAANSPTA